MSNEPTHAERNDPATFIERTYAMAYEQGVEHGQIRLANGVLRLIDEKLTDLQERIAFRRAVIDLVYQKTQS